MKLILQVWNKLKDVLLLVRTPEASPARLIDFLQEDWVQHRDRVFLRTMSCLCLSIESEWSSKQEPRAQEVIRNIPLTLLSNRNIVEQLIILCILKLKRCKICPVQKCSINKWGLRIKQNNKSKTYLANTK